MSLDFRVRVAWTTDPFSAVPVWVDVSSFVEVGPGFSIDITRGTTDLSASVDPSTLSLAFNNKDGRFTAGYTAGAYYPNVVLGKRIQVHAFDGVTYFPRFDGFIDTLPMQWAPTGRLGWAQVTAVDRLKKLGRQLFTDNLVSTTIKADGPLDYWTMGDPTNTIHPYNQTGEEILSSVPDYGGGAEVVEFQSDQLLTTDGLLPVKMTLAALWTRGHPHTQYTLAAGGSVSMECFFVSTTTGVSAPLALSDSTLFNSFEILVSVPGSPNVAFLNFQETFGGTISSTITGTTNLLDGAAHHLAAVYDGSGTGTLTLYVDGVQEGQNTAIGAGLLSYRIDTIGGVTTGAVRMSHVAFYNEALTPTQVADHADAGLYGFSGETSADRFTRVAAFASITPTVTGTSGTQSMGPITDLNGRSVLDLLQETQDTENGAMFVATDGTLKLVPRTAFYNLTPVSIGQGDYTPDIQLLLDDSRLYNLVSVTDGTTLVQSVTNATSVTANGTYSLQKTLNTNTSNEALGWAQWIVNVESQNSVGRISQVTLNLLTQSSLRATAWALDIGSAITINNLPTGGPSVAPSVQIAGYTESYSLENYSMTVNTVPYYETGLFTFNNTPLGRFDTGGILAY